MSDTSSCCPVVESFPRISITEQAQIAKIPGVLIRLTEVESRLSTLTTTVDTNKQTCEAAHGTMNANITANQTAIATEKTQREGADTSIASALTTKAAKTTVDELEEKVDAEITNRINGDSALAGSITTVQTSVATEKTNRENADAQIRTDVDTTVQLVNSTLRSEIAATKGSLETSIADAKSDVTAKVTTEETQRKAEDAVLLQKITDEETARKAKDTQIETLISTKDTNVRADFATADAALQAQITTSAQTIATNKALFDAAKTSLESADAVLAQGLQNEKTARETADTTNLQAAKDYAKSLLSSALRYQGQVANMTELNTKTATAQKGDMWNVVNNGSGHSANYAFNGVGWDKVSDTIDLSPYATKVEVNAEKTRAETAEAALDEKIAANTTKINTDVGAEKTRAMAAEATLQGKINTEEAARIAKDSSIETSVTTLSGHVTTEVSRVEALITSTCNTKETAAIGRENAIKAELQAKDNSLEASINALTATVSTNKTNIENALAQEVTNRTNAVTEVRNQLKVTDIGGGERLVGMGEVLMKIGQKQDKLESGTNIKTINGHSVLGGGNLQVTAETAFIMTLAYNAETEKLEFDVTADEVKVAIDNGDDIVIMQNMSGKSLPYRLCLIEDNTNTITVYTYCPNDGNTNLLYFSIAKVAGLWQYYGDIQYSLYDLNLFKNKLANSAGTLKQTEDNLTALQGTVGTLGTTVGAHTTSIQGLTDSVGSLTTRIGSAESNISSLETRVGNAEGNLVTLQNTVQSMMLKDDEQDETLAQHTTAISSKANDSDVSKIFSEGKWKSNSVSGEGIQVGGVHVLAYKIQIWNKSARTFIAWYYTREPGMNAKFATSIDNLKNGVYAGNYTSYSESTTTNLGVLNDGTVVRITRQKKGTIVDTEYDSYEENVISFTEMKRIEGVESKISEKVSKSGDSMEGDLDFGSYAVMFGAPPLPRQYKSAITKTGFKHYDVDNPSANFEVTWPSKAGQFALAADVEAKADKTTTDALADRIAAIEALFNSDKQLLIKNADKTKTYSLGIEKDSVTGEDTLVITEQA